MDLYPPILCIGCNENPLPALLLLQLGKLGTHFSKVAPAPIQAESNVVEEPQQDYVVKSSGIPELHPMIFPPTSGKVS
jgi:hypothetical protein